MENNNKYDLIIQNSASKRTYLYQGLKDYSTNHLYYKFDVDLSDCPVGEATYAVLVNNRSDVKYDFRVPLLETIIHTEDGDVLLRDIQPATGLLRVGKKVEEANIYDNTAYSGETTDQNNTIFYYEG